MFQGPIRAEIRKRLEPGGRMTRSIGRSLRHPMITAGGILLALQSAGPLDDLFESHDLGLGAEFLRQCAEQIQDG